MKKIKTIALWAVWTVAGLYLFIIVLLKIPAIQAWTGSALGSMIEKKIGARAEVGRVEIGLLNRIVADDVRIYDKAGCQMLRVARLAAKVDLLPLFNGKVSISSAQVFGMNATLYKKAENAQPNFQFAIDALSSKDTTANTPLDLRIQSLVVRNGAVGYDEYYKPRTPGVFNTSHIYIKDLSSHIKLNALTGDSLSIYAKRLSLKEASGLELRDLSFHAKAGKEGASVEDLIIRLPGTRLSVAVASAAYRMQNGKIDMETLKFNVKLNKSEITPCNLTCFYKELKTFNNKLNLFADISGTGNSVIVNNLYVHSAKGEISIIGNGNVRGLDSSSKWNAHLKDFKINSKGIKLIAGKKGSGGNTPADVAARLGGIHFRGDLSGHKDFIACRGKAETRIGNAELDITLNGNSFNGGVSTAGIDLGVLADNKDFGTVAANIKASGKIAKGSKPIPIELATAKGKVEKFEYKSYCYRNISIDGTYNRGIFNGLLAIDDPNGKANIEGRIDVAGTPAAKLTAEVVDFNPRALQLTDKTGNNSFSFLLKADVCGNSLETASGTVSVDDFKMYDGNTTNRINNLVLSAESARGEHSVSVESDFGNASIRGKYNYGNLVESLTRVISSKLPTLPWLPQGKYTAGNWLDVDIHINDLGWLGNFLGIPLELHSPLDVDGTIDNSTNMVDMTIDMPEFSYDGSTFANTHARISTQNDTLQAIVRTDKMDGGDVRFSVDADLKAADNRLYTNILWNVNGKSPLHGTVNAETDFYKSLSGAPVVHTAVKKSGLTIDKTRLDIQSSEITYSDNILTIDNFKVSNNRQYLTINGAVTKNAKDSLTIDMQNLDVGYILDLVNFHSVSFSGYASGRATVKSLFSMPDASADIKVDSFRFDTGRMGTLYAKVDYGTGDKQININAVADDGPDAQTIIKGYVSPARNYIDLGIEARGTRLEFLEKYCGSFMGNINARGNGHCRVVGDLRYVNLEGKMTADGTIDIKPLGTTYTLRHDTITMVPNEIMFMNDTIYDIYGRKGIVNGALHHKNLGRLTYDIDVRADNLLAYDTHDYNGNTFYGTVFATGNCIIKGRPGEITMDIEATPEKGSFIEYNAASRESIAETEFIRWRDATPRHVEQADTTAAEGGKDLTAEDKEQTHTITFPEIPSDVVLSFLVNTTPDFTLRVLMDQQTGDYIALNGSGVIRANYFNKGAFEMFGNYLVEDGLYKLTIQNIIKKEFRFQQGSSIAFGGDPFGAAINLKGIYTLNAVSLSDLQIGRSFKSNNIKVNCLMDITGTAGQPNVSFDLDLPTLDGDARQMVRSVINSEEDMNQQVLYLLAVGRFYPQGNNNAAQEDENAQSQTSLAMQSLLSGTISQQINTVLSNVVKSSNWNFGANISTGDEGWNNAEYEGLLSGRLLNNRLLINGQFGYRDRINTTEGSSFIGDFDIRYLLFPSGNLAIKVYNQTNDRYFTRNSLTTQGIGLIMKKDFTRLSDIFGKKKKKKDKGQTAKDKQPAKGK